MFKSRFEQSRFESTLGSNNRRSGIAFCLWAAVFSKTTFVDALLRCNFTSADNDKAAVRLNTSIRTHHPKLFLTLAFQFGNKYDSLCAIIL